MTCSWGSTSGRSSSEATPPAKVFAKSPANILPELDLTGSVVATEIEPYSSGNPMSAHVFPDAIHSVSISISTVVTPSLSPAIPWLFSASATGVWVYSTRGVLNTISLALGDPKFCSYNSSAV